MDLQSSSSGPEGLSGGLAEWLGTGVPAADVDGFWESLCPPDAEDDLVADGDLDLPDDADDLGWLLNTDQTPTGAEQAPVSDRFDGALARLRSAAGELICLAGDPRLVLADRDRLIGWTRELEQVGNRLAVPGQSLVNVMEAVGCRIDGPVGLFASPEAFLVALLGIPFGEARCRVRAARLLAPTYQPNGGRVEARYRSLADAQATGDIPADRVGQVTKALAGWERLLDVPDNNVTTETLEVAEDVLVRQARVFGGRDLDRVIGRLGAYLCPDGMLDNRPAQEAVRSVEISLISRGLHQGMYTLRGRLTAETGAKTLAVLDSLSKPQPVTDQTGRLVEPDRRDRGMRLHDGLDAVMDRALRAGDLPAHGGTPATLIITTQAQDLFAGTGTGVTETGDELPIDTVVGLADEAEIVRTVFHKETREILFLGRTRRLASYAQTVALTVRDGGCTFPGCSTSPKWCQRHHLVDWVNGGNTDLPNLTLLCAFHHYRFARHGWTAEYQHGRVWWRPPKIIDPDQKPILNIRHRGTPLIT